MKTHLPLPLTLLLLLVLASLCFTGCRTVSPLTAPVTTAAIPDPFDARGLDLSEIGDRELNAQWPPDAALLARLLASRGQTTEAIQEYTQLGTRYAGFYGHSFLRDCLASAIKVAVDAGRHDLARTALTKFDESLDYRQRVGEPALVAALRDLHEQGEPRLKAAYQRLSYSSDKLGHTALEENRRTWLSKHETATLALVNEVLSKPYSSWRTSLRTTLLEAEVRLLSSGTHAEAQIYLTGKQEERKDAERQAMGHSTNLFLRRTRLLPVDERPDFLGERSYPLRR